MASSPALRAAPADLRVRGLSYTSLVNAFLALLPLAPKGTSRALKYTGLLLSSHEFLMPSPVNCGARRRVSGPAAQRPSVSSCSHRVTVDALLRLTLTLLELLECGRRHG